MSESAEDPNIGQQSDQPGTTEQNQQASSILPDAINALEKSVNNYISQVELHITELNNEIVVSTTQTEELIKVLNDNGFDTSKSENKLNSIKQHLETLKSKDTITTSENVKLRAELAKALEEIEKIRTIVDDEVEKINKKRKISNGQPQANIDEDGVQLLEQYNPSIEGVTNAFRNINYVTSNSSLPYNSLSKLAKDNDFNSKSIIQTVIAYIVKTNGAIGEELSKSYSNTAGDIIMNPSTRLLIMQQVCEAINKIDFRLPNQTLRDWCTTAIVYLDKLLTSGGMRTRKYKKRAGKGRSKKNKHRQRKAYLTKRKQTKHKRKTKQIRRRRQHHRR